MANYFTLLPFDLRHYFAKRYLAKELSLMYQRFAPLVDVTLKPEIGCFLHYCVSHNYLTILQWYQRQGDLVKLQQIDLDDSVNLESLISQYYNCYWRNGQNCHMDDTLVTNAICAGHTELVKWLVAQGCPWGENSCYEAARTGNLPLLQWILQSDRQVANQANSSFAKRAMADSKRQHLSTDGLCTAAAAGGQMEVLKWLYANGYSGDEDSCTEAANHGHLEILQFLRANNSPWHEEICSNAASAGHLQLLDWAYANGATWYIDDDETSVLANNGNIAILDWILQHQLHLDYRVLCIEAATHGNLQVLQWAQRNNYDIDLEIRQIAQVNRYEAIVAWYDQLQR